MARFSKQMYTQRALAGALPAAGENNPNKFALGALMYDETAGFTYQLRMTVGASGVKRWGVLQAWGDVVSTITTVTMTAALMTARMNANYAGSAMTLPAAALVPVGVIYSITNINAADLTISAAGGDTALAPAVVLADIGSSVALVSDGLLTWTQVVNDPGAT